MWFLILILALFLLFIITHNMKIPKVPCVAIVTGAPKTGKSTYSVYTAIKEHKARLHQVKFRNFARMCLHPFDASKRNYEEIPLLYSNVPLDYKYCVNMNLDLLLRKKRFNYKSVCYIQEVSLVADSMSFKDADVNDKLLEFNKLFGHETKGGVLIYDTQCIQDCHYSIKRCVSNYFYIHHTIKWIPFVLVMYMRELMYSEDNNNINVYDDDVEDTLKRVIVPKRIWKKFDAYCYSVKTDNLPVVNELAGKPTTLKTDNVLSIKGVGKNAKKND